MISHKAKYALRAVLALARAPQGQPRAISEIARDQRIPKKFLEQILLDLKHHGILESRRGKGGGYALRRAPQDISFGEILRLIDGPVAPLPCLSLTAYQKCADCGAEEHCETRRVFARVARQTRETLDNATIAEAIADSESLEALGPHALAQTR